MSIMPTVEQIVILLQGMTQEERRRLGESVGLSFNTVQKIALRQTRNPRIDTFTRLCEAINVNGLQT